MGLVGGSQRGGRWGWASTGGILVLPTRRRERWAERRNGGTGGGEEGRRRRLGERRTAGGRDGYHQPELHRSVGGAEGRDRGRRGDRIEQIVIFHLLVAVVGNFLPMQIHV
jgi:hypothetical protein